MSQPSVPDALAQSQHPAALLQRLIQFDTTNPPGNEAECVSYLQALLAEAGIEGQILARDPVRTNLVARVKGRGEGPALLLHGHIDVVTTAGQSWQQPPFAGISDDQYIWGRGALDMKSGVAMMVAALLRARAEGVDLPGDVVLALVSDEEAGGDYGAGFLVDQHPDLFSGVRYALGEGGGTALSLSGQRFYPIMVAEKHPCWMQAVIRGPGGHGSRPLRGGVMGKLGRLLHFLDHSRLPVHVTPVAQQMLEAIAEALPGPAGASYRHLLSPELTDTILDTMGEAGSHMDPLLHNTVSATIVHGGEKINVIPSEVVVNLDGRLLPGYSLEDMLAELRPALAEDIEMSVVRLDSGPDQVDMTLYEMLADILREADPEGIPIPFLSPGFTDGRLFARLGIQTYGWLPLNLPAEPELYHTVHGADERVPVAALDFGTNALYQALRRFGDAVR